MLLVFTPTFKTSSSAAPPGGLRISDNVHNFIENGPIGYDNSFIDNSRHALIICPPQRVLALPLGAHPAPPPANIVTVQGPPVLPVRHLPAPACNGPARGPHSSGRPARPPRRGGACAGSRARSATGRSPLHPGRSNRLLKIKKKISKKKVFFSNKVFSNKIKTGKRKAFRKHGQHHLANQRPHHHWQAGSSRPSAAPAPSRRNPNSIPVPARPTIRIRVIHAASGAQTRSRLSPATVPTAQAAPPPPPPPAPPPPPQRAHLSAAAKPTPKVKTESRGLPDRAQLSARSFRRHLDLLGGWSPERPFRRPTAGQQ